MAVTMWDNLNIPPGITQSLDTIFAAVMLGGIERGTERFANGSKEFDDDPMGQKDDLYTRKYKVFKNCIQRFKGRFPFNVFYNTHAILYEILITLKTEVFSVDQLDSIIEANRDLILNSPYINRQKYQSSLSGTIINDDDFIMVVSENLKDATRTLSQIEVTEEMFISSCNVYVDWFKENLMLYTSLSMSSIMQQGLEVKKINKRIRTYRGIEDCRAFYNEQLDIINALAEESHIKSTEINLDWFKAEVEKEKLADEMKMFLTGLKEIDGPCGPTKRGRIIGIVGPPKGGKTRFTNFLVQIALQHGFNVCIWPLEGTVDEWIAMQTSCLLAFESKRATSNTNEMVFVSSNDIENREYRKSAEMTKQVMSAKMMLASNTKLGKLTFMEGTAFVEDMFDQLVSHYENKNQFDVLVIDQLINVMSRTGKGRVERVNEAYIKMKDFLANKLRVPALGIMPSQLKQTAIDALRKDPDMGIDVTAGGESAETIRTPDEIWGLFSSKEERENNIMKIYSVASRHSGTFPDFQCRCFLQSCYFASQED